MKPKDPNERRRKRLYVDEERLFVFLMQTRFDANAVTHIALPWALKLPEDVQVIGVWHDFMRRSFCFMLQSATFDEVHECCEAPWVDVEWEYLKATVERPKRPNLTA
jgi:hypothetical protein